MYRFIASCKKKIITLGISLTLLASTAVCAAMPEIMPLQELTPGMRGTGYTVVGPDREIRPFDVEIIGVIAGGKMTSPRIVVNVSGPVIESTGGAVSGMSGSPIYFDGKLAGALAATFKEMHIDKVLLTPIEDMLKIWDYPDRMNKTSWPQVDLQKAQEDNKRAREDFENKIDQVKQKLHEYNNELHEEVGNPNLADNLREPAVEDNNPNLADNLKEDGEETPVIEEKASFVISGFSDRGVAFLRESLGKAGLEIKSSDSMEGVASASTVVTDAKLEPGSTVGVSVAAGDFSLGSVGTVTAVDGKRVLAFGHPFSHRGNVNYFMTDARVIGTVHGPLNGMKLATPISIIGRINQDRNDGIAGVLGEFPQVVPVTVEITDQDTNQKVNYNSMIAYDEELLPAVTSAMAYNAMVSSIDRENGNTADIKFTIRTNMAKNNKLVRRNMFYDSNDVAKTAVSELTSFMNTICNNRERESDIIDVKVKITLDSTRKTASLISAIPSKNEVKPGETIHFATTLKPYRGDKITLSVPYTVPLHQLEGPLNLDIHGGGLVNVAKLLLAQQNGNGEEESQKTTEQQLKEMADANHNNDIVIETAVAVPQTEAEQKAMVKKAIEQSKKADKLRNNQVKSTETKKTKPDVNRYSTNYLIDNVIHATLQVKLKEK